ncbi:MAG TPA: outer membrane beta-barrel protein [Kofleriaceae bacterium]|nr:outer membrane beta-barrel protein [Kofleriaceae bacterium]
MRGALPVLAFAGLGAMSGVAHADRPASTGVYAEAGIGATGHLATARNWSAIGPTVDLRVGYDLFSWLSVGVALSTASHEATVPAPPEGEWYQLYQGRGDARLGFRYDSLAFFAEGGAGAAYISSNVLGKVMILDPGERFTIAFAGGGGLEYQLQNRHYAFGFAATYWMLPQFDALQGVEGRFFLRYTYGGSH